MHIKFFATWHNLEIGGGAHRTLDLKIKSLIEKGHTASLTTFYSDRTTEQKDSPYPVYKKNAKGKSFRQVQQYVFDTLNEEVKGADLFHMDGQSFIWAGGRYRRQEGSIPVVAYLKGYVESMSVLHKYNQSLPLVKRTIKNIKYYKFQKQRFVWDKLIGLKYANTLDAIFVNSPVTKEIYNSFGFNEERLFLLPPFIDIENTKRAHGDNPYRNGFNIVYTGRFVYDKGVDVLIKSVQDIAEKKDIYLHLIGLGPQQEYLEKLILKYKLEKRVTIYPWKPTNELMDYYRYADLFIHPIRWPEPFGRTIVEAMMVGTPVITAEWSGSAWAMKDGGITFKNGNVSDLREKILYMLEHPDERKRCGQKGVIRAQELDYKKTANKLERKLLDIVSK